MRLSASVAASALLAWTQAAAAQTADRPDVRPGDQWKFAVFYSVPSETPNRAWTITSVTDTAIEGTENGEPLRLTREMNVIESPRDRSTDFRLLSFPLEVGKRWRYVNDWLFKATGSTGRCTEEASVVAHEKVSVPAGEFDAFRIASTCELSGGSPTRFTGQIKRKYWYAPAAGAIVKSVTHDPYIGVITVQLVTVTRTR
jgi:hypothetical protein